MRVKKRKTRPYRFTAKQGEEALIQSKGIISVAAKNLGCSHGTVLNYIKRYKSLQTVLREINEKLIDFTEGKLYQRISEGNTTAIIFHLKTKGKHRGYVERQMNKGEGDSTTYFIHQ